MLAKCISILFGAGLTQNNQNMKKEMYFPTQHVVGHMNLDVPFTVEHHLTFDALVCLLLKT